METSSHSSRVLLSPQESQQRARELQCWTASQEDSVEQALLRLLAAWRLDWDIPWTEDAPRPPVALSDAQARRAMAAHMAGNGTADSIMSASPAEGSAPFAQAIAGQAWNDWLARLAHLLEDRPATAAELPEGHKTYVLRQDAIAPWDGGLDIKLPWWEGWWHLRLAPAAVERVLAAAGQLPLRPIAPEVLPQQALTAITVAMAQQVVTVHVELSPLSLTLGQIEHLGAGDLVMLDHCVSDPASALIQADTEKPSFLCSAWLGQHQGRMAVELLPAPSSSFKPNAR
jgi:flagellar motor switch protein FliM/N